MYPPEYLKIMTHTQLQSTVSPPVTIRKAKAERKFLRWGIISTDLLIYLVSYIIFYFIKKKVLIYDNNYTEFLLIFVGAWLLGGLLSGKFRLRYGHHLIVKLKRHYSSLLLSLGAIAIFLLQTEYSISRFVVVGSYIAAFLFMSSIELYLSNGKVDKTDLKKGSISYSFLFIDFTILTWILFFLFERKIGLGNLNENHIILIASTYISWVIAAFITHQFSPFNGKFNFWKAIGTQFKFYLLILALTSIIVYILQLPEFYKSLFITSVILYAFWSIIVATFLFLDHVPQKTDDIKHDFLHAYELKIPAIKSKSDTQETLYKFPDEIHDDDELRKKLEFIYFKEFPEIFDLLERKLDLNTFNTEKTTVLKSRDPYNILILAENSLELLINLHVLNDIRRLNSYLIDINKRLMDGGIFVGTFEPIRYRYKRFLRKNPYLISNLLYLFDFMWHRITPKLPVIRKIFFAFTKGKDRAISLAEGLGRLYYCGFEVLDLKDLDNNCYFVAKKVREPSTDENPSYSPIFKMKRFGKNGKPIFVYKFRTMHPYSEYLQDFVYKHNALAEGGKFSNDFRITNWGKMLRRFWIDELPMLINWFNGDCKLVGVRPLSRQYLSLYDEEYKAERFNFKPGLIPPYYVDMPKSLPEIIESEKRYLNSFQKNRIKTDITYFIKAFNNIIINNKRSS